MTQKITKKDQFSAIIEALSTVEDRESVADLIEFCAHEIELLEKKAAKAKENAEKKKSESDELTELIKDALTDEYATIADITAKLDKEDVTVHKVMYRLNLLAKNGLADKTELTIKGEDGKKSRKVVAYALATGISED